MATGIIPQPIPEGKILNITLSQGQSFTITTFRKNSFACIVFGFLRAVGTVMLGVKLDANQSSQSVQVVDLMTGSQFSNNRISFTPTLINESYYLTIANTNPSSVSGNHTLTIIGS